MAAECPECGCVVCRQLQETTGSTVTIFEGNKEIDLHKYSFAIRQDQSLAINAKARKICGILQQKGLLYEQQIHASLLVVHHQNRSGMMLNSFDCHKTGLAALRVGWQEAKLCESLCFEAETQKKGPCQWERKIQNSIFIPYFAVCQSSPFWTMQQ